MKNWQVYSLVIVTLVTLSFIMSPEASSSDYKQWKKEYGIVIPEDDEPFRQILFH